METKEQTLFPHSGNTILTTDREVPILAKYEEPLVVLLGNVLSNSECDGLIRLSTERLKRSKVGSGYEIDELRTSSSVFLDSNENELVERLENRVSHIMGIPPEHGEGLQVLHYLPGQEFKPHVDYFQHAAENPRISTLIVYLNDVEEGGETIFPRLNLSVSPRKGAALYFEYFYEDKGLNELTLHAGTPVVAGEKWALTQWMRRKRLS